MKKQYAFVKYTKKGALIPGSLVVTSAYPKETANGVWEEVPMNLCCDPITTTTTIAPVVQCLDGLIIETIYLGDLTDLDLLPLEYEHPCPDEIGAHTCNRALFEIYGNSVYIGDSKINNDEGAFGGPVTLHGTFICGDYLNTPAPLTGGTWTGSVFARYNKYIITTQQALDIAAAGVGTVVSFSLDAAMTTYGISCDEDTIPHSNTTWVRISLNNGTVIYNGCPDGNIAILDVCAIPTTTTTAAPLPLRMLFSNIIEVDTIVGDSSNVADWNIYFDLPTYGGLFTSVIVIGNYVELYGGSNIIIKESLFDQADELGSYLLDIDDQAECIIEVEYNGFGYDTNQGCFDLISINLPKVTIAGDYAFSNAGAGAPVPLIVNLPLLATAGYECLSWCSTLETISLPSLTICDQYFLYVCSSLTTVFLPSCTNLGGNVGNNQVFAGITSNNITLTVPAALMTCNGGNPDGDIVYLQANNTVTIVTV